MNVKRTLPQRGLPTVGAWCFLDSFGPDRVAMKVLPHPHIGLQTVTWPLEGAVRHRDSLGSDVIVRPGELNIMTAGNGISHSEFSILPGDVGPPGPVTGPSGSASASGQPHDAMDQPLPIIRGLQLWVALPNHERHRRPLFEQHRELPVAVGDGFEAVVMVGTFAGEHSPATTYTPIVGVDVSASGGATLPLERSFEHALLVLDGAVVINGQEILPGPLAYLGGSRDSLSVDAGPGSRFLLLGGEPFREDLLMWWNFVGRTHDEVVQAREDWEMQASLEPDQAPGARFGFIDGHGPDAGGESGRIPAPPLPAVRLRPRNRSQEGGA
jgi:redox-sensitive bicupin YhaK (pirin superfamily)